MYLFWLEISGKKWLKATFLHLPETPLDHILIRLGIALLRLSLPANPILFSLFC